ncbi:MAG: cytochrome c biogenesis protein CcdA [Litoreibacter sp.]|uniref:cytochrome c biogenesis CcdA family protein n=1 Tax=Litoreibacter sp. TaxID=1969459 RepID=UPI0032992AF7
MELIFAYLAGLLTLINPCVLPVLPIVLVSALNADRRGPIALAAGMSVSFVTFGMVVATFGRAIGLTERVLADTGAIAMLIFGAILLLPPLSSRFEVAMAGLSAKADGSLAQSNTGGIQGQFLGGLLLGAVWSPCIGPTLGGAIALASQGESLFWAFLIMVGFALGVSTLILGIGLGGQELIRGRAIALKALASKSKPILGGVFVAVGLMILFRINHMIDYWAIQNLPEWLVTLSVSI